MKDTLRFAPDIDLCRERAEEIFLKEAGLDREGEKYREMREEACLVLDEILADMKPAAAYTYYDEFTLTGRNLEVGGEVLSCEAFEKISAGSISGIRVFAATSGFTARGEGSILSRVYEDLWGTAFTDSVRVLLLEELAREDCVSRSFGPGFYGMDLSSVRILDRLADFSAAGMMLGDNDMLLPEKSCVGIVFSTREDYVHPGNACSYCKGSSRGCNMCYEKYVK